MKTKTCTVCNQKMNLTDFNKCGKPGSGRRRPECRSCGAKARRKNNPKMREPILKHLSASKSKRKCAHCGVKKLSRRFAAETIAGKTFLRNVCKDCRAPGKRTSYQKSVSTRSGRKKRRTYNRKAMQRWVTVDPKNKLRQQVSRSINQSLARVSSGKNGGSCLNYLPFTMGELRTHLESIFEPWMNWNNWGKYDITTWDDNDQSTWTWNIDHIKPCSSFYYTSMNSRQFKACWSLSNLRPLSSKQNIIDGNRR